MASHLRISGPLFVGSAQQGGSLRFVLLLSNLSENDVVVDVKVYAASFAGFEIAATWLKLVDETFYLPMGQIKTLKIKVDKKFEFYQFHVENSLPNICFHPTLYLHVDKHKTTHIKPLIVGNEWEIEELKP